MTRFSQFSNGFDLVLWMETGPNFFDSQLAGDRFSGSSTVASQHEGMDSLLGQRLHDLTAFLSEFVFKEDAAEETLMYDPKLRSFRPGAQEGLV